MGASLPERKEAQYVPLFIWYDMFMNQYKILFLDVDGVLALPPKLFSDIYCEKYNIDPEKHQAFYSSDEFRQSLVGKYDLKEAIKAHNNLWQWSGDFSELIDMWLKAENYPNEALLEIVADFRERGGSVYLATQQEQYRAKYIREVMFKYIIDGMFSSCDIGADKHDNIFWTLVLEQLTLLHPTITPGDILYFDDRQTIVDVAKRAGIHARLYTRIDDVTASLQTQ